LSVLPVGQTVFHDQAEIGLTLSSVLALAGLLAVVFFAVVRREKNLFLSVAVGWFLLFLAPTFVVPLKETMAEHRAFIGLLGVAWSVAWLLELLGDRPRQVVTFIIVASLGFGTVQRNSVWSTEVTLWEEATLRAPESAEAWYGFGEAQRYTLANPELPEAEADRLDPISAFDRAVELDPEYKEAWNKLGISHAELGHTEQAIQAWQEALRIDPRYCKPHTNWGKALAQMGRNTESLEELQSALTWCPDNSTAHYFTALLLDQRMNDVERARFHYEAVLVIEPTFGCPFGVDGGQCLAEEVRQRILELTW
jgi:tetratricopeptide (TPR) repeat protein